MKTLILIVALPFAGAFGSSNDDLALTDLEGLQALEAARDLDGLKSALTWFNENALAHLPVAATLRAEDAIARAAIALVD